MLVSAGIVEERAEEHETTYPKRMPPKATKRPMRMAGVAEPGASCGGLIIMPMARNESASVPAGESGRGGVAVVVVVSSSWWWW